jgi:hypothetical protein
MDVKDFAMGSYQLNQLNNDGWLNVIRSVVARQGSIKQKKKKKGKEKNLSCLSSRD